MGHLSVKFPQLGGRKPDASDFRKCPPKRNTPIQVMTVLLLFGILLFCSVVASHITIYARPLVLRRSVLTNIFTFFAVRNVKYIHNSFLSSDWKGKFYC